MKNTRILFVCLGNICRSPAAEGIMLKLVKQAGLDGILHVDSAGIGGWHAGVLPDKRMRGRAAKRGYNLCSRARKFAPATDFAAFDLIIGMDDENILALQEMATTPGDLQKIHRMTEFCRQHAGDEVPDPYFGETAAFDRVLDILEDAAGGLLERLRQEAQPGE